MAEVRDGESTGRSEVGERGSSGPEGELASHEMSPLTRWLLLDGDRRFVALGVLIVVLVVLGGLLRSGAIAVTNEDSLTRLFSALVGGNLTLITVAISINQLILSRQLDAPDELRDRIHGVIEYRHEVEATAGADVSPIAPDEFLDFLVQQMRHRAAMLRDSAGEMTDGEASADVERYAETIVEQSDRVSEKLEGRPGNPVDTVVTILDADFTSDIYATERLEASYGEALTDEASDALRDIYELLEHTGVARQYFKTLYMQRELADLSRKILYLAIPAIAFSIVTVWLYGHPSGAVLSESVLTLLVLFSTVVAVAPLALLVAYILRITTITRQTASLMPFEIRGRGPL